MFTYIILNGTTQFLGLGNDSVSSSGETEGCMQMEGYGNKQASGCGHCRDFLYSHSLTFLKFVNNKANDKSTDLIYCSKADHIRYSTIIFFFFYNLLSMSYTEECST
jgi:hypothetical protein